MSLHQKTVSETLYHSLLRIAVCVCALVLVFDSGLVYTATQSLSQGAQDYVATAVGVKVSVPENEVNVLTSRITELEQELAAKDREIAVSLSTETNRGTLDTSTFVLSVILFILLVLIVLNYALDYIRATESISNRRQTPVSQ
jgi:hypothetical protein